MADSFNLIRTPRLVFGPGKALELPALLMGHGPKLLIITGAGSFRNNRPVLDLLDRLNQKKYRAHIESFGSEPSPEDVNRITARFEPQDIDVIVAIGGGSVIDAGKAVSAMLKQRGDVKDFLEGVGTKSPSGEKVFFVAVPTTSGTGSEATSNAVITQTGENGFKKSLRHDNFVPDIALVDPLFTLSCPPAITAASGMDCFTQLMESYLSTKASTFTDALARDGIRNIKGCIEKAVFEGNDISARSGMAYAAFISGITLSNAGLGLIHGLASAIGGFHRIPHGLVCGTLMGVVNRYNVYELLKQKESTIAHEKYARIGRLLSGSDEHETEWYLKFVVDYIEQLVEKFRIRKLGDFGINEQSLGKIVASADHKANPVKFEKNSLIEMLKIRL